jgi:hypothetical protein
MKKSLLAVVALLILLAGVWSRTFSVSAADGSQRSAENEKEKTAGKENAEERIKRGGEQMVRVTAKPFFVVWSGIFSCRWPPSEKHTPHGSHWIDVFVTPGGTNAMMTGKGTYPEGTMILKQKYSDEKATETEFFTGMLKREEGYNPDAGDWEFFMLNASGTMVTARGRIESCVECHQKYAATDFVARDYLKERKK